MNDYWLSIEYGTDFKIQFQKNVVGCRLVQVYLLRLTIKENKA